MEDVEREHIQRVLISTGFHKSRTAEVLGISRKTLDRKIDEYSLDAGRANRLGGE
jgi:two-component system response regulator HydG